MNKNILIVDDNPDILISSKLLLEKRGFNVQTVNSGQECIDKIKKGFKGLVCIDIFMPFMDGWDTIRKLVNMNLIKNINIIVMSAISTYNENKTKELEPYIDNYLCKLCGTSKFVETIEQYL